MSIFGRSTELEKSTLLIALESGVVRVGIVLSAISEKPTLVFEIEESLDAPGDASIDRLTLALTNTLSRACEHTHKEGLPHIASRRVSRGLFDKLVIIYGAPWYISRARSVSIEHDTPLLLSQKNIPRLIETYAKDILPHDEQMTLIESAVTGFTMNGYPVTNPHGKKADRVGMTLFASAVPTRLKRAVEETVLRFFATKNPRTYSVPFVVATTLPRTNTSSPDFLFVDVSSRTTEITHSSREGRLLTVSFPKGTLFLREESARGSATLPHEVNYALETGETTKVHGEEKERVRESLKKASEQWANTLTEVLQKISMSGTTPSALFLRVEKGYREPLYETLMAYKETLKLRDPMTIKVLSEEETKPFCSVAGGVKSDDILLRLTTLLEESPQPTNK
ncbi:MAG: hypothetical protein AAB460_01020 [Patescibacteria group bacterium]